ncbi:MAG: hypothetical protein KC635_04620 [Myxococcales bacterium]|nr:hypothetical protein [Myxococcales bacterium]
MPAPRKPLLATLMDALSVPERRLKAWLVIALIAGAYLFGVGVRLAWVPKVEANPQAVWAGHVTLTATDGYFFASAVQHAVEGGEPTNMRLPPWEKHAITTIATAAVHVLDAAPLEVTFYLPVFLAPLLAVPLVLLGRLVGAPLFGFAAGAFAVVGLSYFNRSLPGYFDTDMVSVTFPMVLVWLLASAVMARDGDGGPDEPRALRYAIAAAFWTASGTFFYNRIAPVLLAFSFGFILYALIFHRRERWVWVAAPLLLVAVWGIPWWARVLALVPLAVVATRVRLSRNALIAAGAVALVVFFLTSPGLDLVMNPIERFSDRAGSTGEGGIKFVSTTSLIRETAKLPFDRLAQRFAGSTLAFVMGVVGYLLLCARHRAFLLALPVVALGAFSLDGGLRFTIFGVPIAALGATWLIFLALGWLVRAARALASRRAVLAMHVVGVLAAVPLIAPNVEADLARTPATALPAGEAELMRDLRAIRKPGDYAVAWWDYGYPLWYFAGVNTLVDGSKHAADTLAVSQILFSDSQLQAANLARAAVELYATTKLPNAPALPRLFRRARKEGKTPRQLLAEMATPAYEPPPKTREIYLYVPQRILPLMISIEKFSQDARRPEGVAEPHQPFSVFSPAVKELPGGVVELQGGYRVDPQRGVVLRTRNGREESMPIATLWEVGVNKSFEPISRALKTYAPTGAHVLLMRSYGSALILDEALLRSNLVQMYLFGNVDKDLFEPVLRTAFGTVYRVIR